VFQVAPEVAIVQSADFFPPMLPDPQVFGRIAAVNALSDIYACGGRPITAINLLAIPKEVSKDLIASLLASAQKVVEEVGAVMLGGHTILDKEIKFGLAVTGVVHPQRIVRHNTPRIGDVLLLTKALGTGAYVTALGMGLLTPEEFSVAAESMQRPNRTAGLALFELGASASTDITGFGFVAHALDMLSSGQASYEIDSAALPFFPRALELAAAGAVCGGSARNVEYNDYKLDYSALRSAPAEALRILLHDAQTSGGLLIALPQNAAQELLGRLAAAQEPGAAIIGRVVAPRAARISVH
jgi:selenide,water dikinase